MNQRFDLLVIVAAIFLAIFVATSVILLVLGVPIRDAGPVADSAPPTTRPPDRPRTFSVPDAPTPPPMWRDERAFRYGSLPDGGSVIDGYRFRPLDDERETSRFGGWAAIPDERSVDGSGERNRGLGDPVFRRDERLPEGFTSEWGETPYRFRPTEPSRSPPDPWRPPRDPRGPRGFTDPRLFEPPPQWGATPPMLPPPLPDLYPSLGPPNDHRLTVR
ncbi:hypothetical protein [Thiocapsa rosea]|uniref:hypothetical protein n=1 Tax=Thiocapsa rosea TaxID=69360 RepID=UPI000EACEBF5|nr:hypothetical protein [Thiocapsa rosea]